MADFDSSPHKSRRSVKQYRDGDRIAVLWSDVQRDSDLWLDDGDCLVHFFAEGTVREQPSLRLHYHDIQALESTTLINRCSSRQHCSSPQHSNEAETDHNPGSLEPRPCESAQYELYLPAPPGLSRDQAYYYHLATRNSFAFASSLPLVGERLGVALCQVWERLQEWDSCICLPDRVRDYCEEQGYLEFAAQPDHALACLAFAEQASAKDLWIDAFAHCVGQCQDLSRSPEYEAISQKTKALILRAALEMDLRIERVLRALGTLLEEELGAECLGLSKPAREHLDRFRSFLHTYYVEKLGYFPPRGDSTFNKRMWTKMYDSFRVLYDYLVDLESVSDLSSVRGMNGGICVVQNTLAFDQRHGYTPLPHPLPLLPSMSPPRPGLRRSESSQLSLRNFRLGRSDSLLERQTDREMLSTATNAISSTALEYPLVQEYQRFERQRLEEKVSIQEARKIRWLLIYGILQMLTSISRAPQEVRDTKSATYPLCVSLAGCPPWTDEEVDLTISTPSTRPSSMLTLPQRISNEIEDRISIHPDCEADSAEDFFAACSLSTQTSEVNLSTAPQLLRSSTQTSKTASLRSSVNSGVSALHRSVVGSLSRRNSTRTSRRHSVASIDLSPCSEGAATFGPASDVGEVDEVLSQFEFGLQMVQEQGGHEPTFEQEHLPALSNTTPGSPLTKDLTRSSSDASSSALDSQATDSNRSSYFDGYESPATDVSTSCMEAAAPIKSDPVKLKALVIPSFEGPFTASPTKRVSFMDQTFRPSGAKPSNGSVSMGCYVPTGYTPTVYTPTGMCDAPITKYTRRRTLSRESNSPILDEQVIVKQVVEEALAPRRRSRSGLDCIQESEGAEAREHGMET